MFLKFDTVENKDIFISKLKKENINLYNKIREAKSKPNIVTISSLNEKQKKELSKYISNNIELFDDIKFSV